MAIAHVQSPTGIAVADIFSDNSEALAFTSGCTPDNFVVACAYTGNSAGNLTAAMEGGAMTAGTGATLGGDQGKISIFWKYAESGDQTVTITTDENGGGGQFGAIGIGEFSGVALSSVEDAADTNIVAGATSHPASDTGIATTTADSLIVSIHAIGTDDVTDDNDASGIFLEDDVSGLLMQFRIFTGGTQANANLTATNTGNADSINVIIAFKGAVAAGSKPKMQILLGVG
jgi:hypothetical protein